MRNSSSIPLRPTLRTSFPPVPLVVLVHDPEMMIDYFVKRAGLARADAERIEWLWGTLLADHASLSSLGTLESVAGSGHLIHLEKPDVALVRIAELLQANAGANAASQVMDALRTASAVASSATPLQ